MPVNSRSWIVRWVALACTLAATPLAAVHYQAAMRDPDIWWHMRVGETIARMHSFPHTAVFSRFDGIYSWAAYSWIFEVLTSQLYRWFSLPALPVFLFVMQIAIGLAIFEAVHSVARRFWPACLLTAAAMAACFHTLSLRPVLFSALFWALEMALIFFALRERSARPLMALPLLFWIWANCHIQFINGLVVLGLLAACLLAQEVMAARFGWEAPELRWTQVAGMLGGSVLATLMSPYSWKLYRIVWDYTSKPAQWDQIVELTAPDFRRPAHYILILLLGWAALSIGRRHTRSVFRVALVGFAAMASLHAVREAWFAAIAAAMVLAEEWRTAEQEAEARSERLIAGAVLASLAVCVVAQAQVGLSAQRLIVELDRMYPVRAASYVADTHPPGPLFNSVNWGGYLIYNLREYPVAGDGRTDAYGGNISNNLRAVEGLGDWKHDPSFATSNLVIIEKSAPLAALLARDPEFRLAYQDHLAAVFTRVNPR